MAHFRALGGSEVELALATSQPLELPKFENQFSKPTAQDKTIPYTVRPPKTIVNEHREARLQLQRLEAARQKVVSLREAESQIVASPRRQLETKGASQSLSRLLHKPSPPGTGKGKGKGKVKDTPDQTSPRPRWTTSQVDKPLSPRIPGDVLPPTDGKGLKANALPIPKHRAVTTIKSGSTTPRGAPPPLPSPSSKASPADLARLKAIASKPLPVEAEEEGVDEEEPTADIPALKEQFWKTSDISFLGDDSPKPSPKRQALPLEIDTMIPAHHHIVEEFPVRPEVDLITSDAVYDDRENKWLKQVFPQPAHSMKPAGRKDAAVLYTWLEEMTARCRRPAEEELEERKDLRTVCQIGYNELTRQVNSRCAEHGAMMVKLWSLIINNFDQNKPLKIEQQKLKELAAQRQALESEVSDLKSQVQMYQEKVHKYESFVQEVSTIHADKMTELANVYRELEDEKSHTNEVQNVVRSRDEDIRKLKHRVVTHEQSMLELRNFLNDINNTQEDIVDFNAKYNRQTRGLADRHTRIGLSDSPEMEFKRHASAVNVVQEFVHEGMRMREVMYEKLGRSIERDDRVRVPADVRDVLVQTDPFYINEPESDAEEEPEEPAPKTPTPEPEKKKKKKKARKLIQFLHFPASLQPFTAGVRGKGRVKSLRWVTRNILQMYSEKIFMDHACDREGRPRLAFPDFVYDFHQTKFGLKDLADQNLLDFCESITLYRKYDECYGVKTFWKMVDSVDISDLRHLNFYLSVFEELRNTNSGRPGLSIIYSTEGGQRFIAMHKLLPVARSVVSNFSPELQSRFLRKLNDLQVAPPPGFPSFFLRGSNQAVVDVDAFFFHLMYGYSQELVKHERHRDRGVISPHGQVATSMSRNASTADVSQSPSTGGSRAPTPDGKQDIFAPTATDVRHHYKLSSKGTHVVGSKIAPDLSKRTLTSKSGIKRNKSHTKMDQYGSASNLHNSSADGDALGSVHIRFSSKASITTVPSAEGLPLPVTSSHSILPAAVPAPSAVRTTESRSALDLVDDVVLPSAHEDRSVTPPPSVVMSTGQVRARDFQNNPRPTGIDVTILTEGGEPSPGPPTSGQSTFRHDLSNVSMGFPDMHSEQTPMQSTRLRPRVGSSGLSPPELGAAASAPPDNPGAVDTVWQLDAGISPLAQVDQEDGAGVQVAQPMLDVSPELYRASIGHAPRIADDPPVSILTQADMDMLERLMPQ